MTTSPNMVDGGRPASRTPAATTATASKQLHDHGQSRTGSPTLDKLGNVLDGIEPADLAAALSLEHPNSALLVAARLGVELNEVRREWRRTMREASHQIHGGRASDWGRWAGNYVPFEDVQRLRGVEHGPDGCRRSARRGVA